MGDGNDLMGEGADELSYTGRGQKCEDTMPDIGTPSLYQHCWNSFIKSIEND